MRRLEQEKAGKRQLTKDQKSRQEINSKKDQGNQPFHKAVHILVFFLPSYTYARRPIFTNNNDILLHISF